MTFKDKYGYELYSTSDPEMQWFVKALRYLNVPSVGSYWLGIKRLLVDNDLIDGGLWKDVSFVELTKLVKNGKVLTVIIIAQMLERGEITL